MFLEKCFVLVPGGKIPPVINNQRAGSEDRRELLVLIKNHVFLHRKHTDQLTLSLTQRVTHDVT